MLLILEPGLTEKSPSGAWPRHSGRKEDEGVSLRKLLLLNGTSAHIQHGISSPIPEAEGNPSQVQIQ